MLMLEMQSAHTYKKRCFPPTILITLLRAAFVTAKTRTRRDASHPLTEGAAHGVHGWLCGTASRNRANVTRSWKALGGTKASRVEGRREEGEGSDRRAAMHRAKHQG
eukprot:9496809-Pyramimonas_sp.AAC.2